MGGRITRSLTSLQKFSLITFLSVLGVTIVGCGVGARLLVDHIVEHDAVLMGDLANLLLTRSLPSSAFTPQAALDRAAYASAINDIATSDGVLRVVLSDIEGRVLWSDESALIGQRFTENAELRAALTGHIEVEIIPPGKEEHRGTLSAVERLEDAPRDLRVTS